MFPFERYIRSLKAHVGNKAQPEGLIAEAYTVKEFLTFISMYLSNIETKFNREERNYDYPQGQEKGTFSIFAQRARPFGLKKSSSTFSNEEFKLARWYILNNCFELKKYLFEHEEELKMNGEVEIAKRQQEQFPEWFKRRTLMASGRGKGKHPLSDIPLVEKPIASSKPLTQSSSSVETNASTTAPSIRRRGRGPCKLIDLEKIKVALGGPLLVEINPNTRRPLSEAIASYLPRAITHTIMTMAPQKDKKSWKDVTNEEKEPLFEHLQHLSSVNTLNREKLQYTHCTGPKPFVIALAQKQESVDSIQSVDRIEWFAETRTRKKTGIFCSVEAENAYNEGATGNILRIRLTHD